MLAGQDAYTGIEAADLIVPGPGVPPTILPYSKHGRFASSPKSSGPPGSPAPIVAITGTKGKTAQATALLGEILQDAHLPARVGGNIGMP